MFETVISVEHGLRVVWRNRVPLTSSFFLDPGVSVIFFEVINNSRLALYK